ncbi:MAG: DNA recombination protein RmuC [Rhodospirillaceae bacterium]
MDILVILTAVIAVGTGILVTLVIQQKKNSGANPSAELIGRISQLAESNAIAQTQLNERLQAQERAVTKAVEDRLSEMAKRLGENLQQNSTRTTETMTKLQERLAVIDAAQKNITELSSRVVGLQDILANKQARGAFGEVQLQDLVRNALPPNAYKFQYSLSNGRRADCIIHLPNPPGSIVIDAKFPLEGYRDLTRANDDLARNAAGKRFTADILTHVSHIAERYILPSETAESALMFLPSEAVYAELHANFGSAVETAWKKRVWIVSPTTLMATLNTVRAVLRDAQMREQASLIQTEVGRLLIDVSRLETRAENLQKHLQLSDNDVRQILISTGKLASRGQRIQELELEEKPTDHSLETSNPSVRIG